MNKADPGFQVANLDLHDHLVARPDDRRCWPYDFRIIMLAVLFFGF